MFTLSSDEDEGYASRPPITACPVVDFDSDHEASSDDDEDTLPIDPAKRIKLIHRTRASGTSEQLRSLQLRILGMKATTLSTFEGAGFTKPGVPGSMWPSEKIIARYDWPQPASDGEGYCFICEVGSPDIKDANLVSLFG